MNDKKTIQLLNEVYQSSKNAVDAIDILLCRTNSQSFQNSLKNSQKHYYDIADEAAVKLHEYNKLPPDSGLLSKLELWAAVKFALFSDSRIDAMAEIMINGSTLGMIDMTKTANQCPDAGKYALALAHKLIRTEQENIDTMREYL